MVHRTNRMGRGERGANLVEMAIVTTLLCLLLMGAVDFGRMFNNYIIMTNAAREGARYASRFPGYVDGIKATTIQEAEDSGLALTDAEIDCWPVTSCDRASGEYIEVRIEHPFDTWMGGLIGVDQIWLRARARMVVFGPDQKP